MASTTSFFNASSYSRDINRQLEAHGAATFGTLDQRMARLARFQEVKDRLNDARVNARKNVEAREKRRAAELEAEGQMLKQAEETQSGMEVEEYHQWKVDEAWDAYAEIAQTHPREVSAIVASLQEVQSALANLMQCYSPEDPMPRTNALLNEYGNDSDSGDSDYTE